MNEHGVFEQHGKNAVQHLEVVEPAGVGGGIVGHEEPEEDEDEILQAEGEPVDVAPGGVLGDDAGEDAGDEDAQEEAGDDDGEGGGAAVARGEFAYQGEH